MPLILEDGTGKVNSNSYADRTFADAYFALRNRQAAVSDGTKWPTDAADAGGAVRDPALILATDYIEYTYRHIFKGNKIFKAQSLSWPRVGATIDGGQGGNPSYIQGIGYAVDGFLIDSNEIPKQLQMATAELAMRSLFYGNGVPSDLAPDIDAGEAAVVHKVVGTIEIEYTPGMIRPFQTYRFVEMLLQPLLTVGAGMTRLVRG